MHSVHSNCRVSLRNLQFTVIIKSVFVEVVVVIVDASSLCLWNKNSRLCRVLLPIDYIAYFQCTRFEYRRIYAFVAILFDAIPNVVVYSTSLSCTYVCFFFLVAAFFFQYWKYFIFLLNVFIFHHWSIHVFQMAIQRYIYLILSINNTRCGKLLESQPASQLIQLRIWNVDVKFFNDEIFTSFELMTLFVHFIHIWPMLSVIKNHFYE